MNEACGIINITDRRKIELTGIKALDSFDEYSVSLTVVCGKLVVEGEGLNITVLDLDRGVVTAEGIINAVVYTEENVRKQGVFSKMFSGRH